MVPTVSVVPKVSVVPMVSVVLTLYQFMFSLDLFLHRFRNELTRSLTN